MKTDSPPATIYDVARKAGVSTATVSRLINDAASVREVTRKRILNAIEELNYIPQRGARPGTKDRLPAELIRPPVAFLKVGDFPDEAHTPVTNQLKQALRKAAERHRLPFHVFDVPEFDPATPAQDLVGKEVKGVFLRTSNMQDVTEESVKWLQGLPAVQVLGENLDTRLWMDHINPDHAMVGIEAADYLMANDCNPLVFAGSGMLHRVILERCTAFVNTARRADKEVLLFYQVPPGEKAEMERQLSSMAADRIVIVESRPELIQQIAAELHGRKFGLFVPSDMLLMVILSQLQVLGHGKTGVSHAIGCNREIRAFAELDHAPATLDLKIDTLAEQAVHRLLRRIQDPDKPFLRISVAPRLVAPDSGWKD